MKNLWTDIEAAEFEDELATKITAGECAWKEYSSDTELIFLYQFNDTEVMISAVFNEITMYAVTYNEYIK